MSENIKQKKSLKHFVRNVLIQRLVTVAIVLSVLVGTATYFNNSHYVESRVIEIALDRLETFRARILEFEQQPDTTLKQAVKKSLKA